MRIETGMTGGNLLKRYAVCLPGMIMVIIFRPFVFLSPILLKEQAG